MRTPRLFLFFDQFEGLDPASSQATALLVRWGRLHAVRTLASLVALALVLARLAR